MKSLPCSPRWWMLALALFAGATAQARDGFDAAAFESGRYRQSVDLSAYAPGETALPASRTFEGRLQLSGQPSTRTRVVDHDYLSRAELALARTLPTDFDVALVQDGSALIPATRGPVASSHGWWEFILEPGQAWDEPGETGYTRASLPFALVQKNANCTHNGVLLFRFGDDGKVSRAAMQVSSETCQYLQLDLWGWLEATYLPAPVQDKAAWISAFRAEAASTLPVRPLSDLARDFPGVDAERFAIGAAAARTRFGVVARGIHYRSGCPTRHGEYPYCDVMTIPSFSLAKSAAAGVALMRLEALYPGTADQPVSRHALATGCRTEAWRDVRFRHLLDMSTGHYDSPAYMADEDDARVAPFFKATSHPHKLAFSCEAYPRRQPPGQRWVYHTPDTYLLGTVMAHFLAQQPGRAGQDLFRDVLVADVYAPIGLSATARATRRTYDEYAQPFLGWGLFLRADDLAKLARFLGADRGQVDGRPLLDAGMLDAAMQRNADARGLPVATLANYLYQHGFWARNVQPDLACGKDTWVPFLSGFGGITMALFPNGVAWYNIADDGLLASMDFGRPAVEAAKMGGYCQP